MTEGHPSRRTWPGPMSVAGVGPGHEHELPGALVKRVRMLTWSLLVFGVCLLLIGTSLVLILLDRSKARDEQNSRTNERINDSICDLLDQLPEGGLLDRPREKYGCGPGIPLDLLTPEEQAQLTRPTVPPAAPTPATTVPHPPMGSAAVPNVEKPEPAPIPPRTGPGPTDPPPPSPAPDPIVDLGPITGPVCDALGVCV